VPLRQLLFGNPSANQHREGGWVYGDLLQQSQITVEKLKKQIEEERKLAHGEGAKDATLKVEERHIKFRKREVDELIDMTTRARDKEAKAKKLTDNVETVVREAREDEKRKFASILEKEKANSNMLFHRIDEYQQELTNREKANIQLAQEKNAMSENFARANLRAQEIESKAQRDIASLNQQRQNEWNQLTELGRNVENNLTGTIGKQQEMIERLHTEKLSVEDAARKEQQEKIKVQQDLEALNTHFEASRHRMREITEDNRRYANEMQTQQEHIHRQHEDLTRLESRVNYPRSEMGVEANLTDPIYDTKYPSHLLRGQTKRKTTKIGKDTRSRARLLPEPGGEMDMLDTHEEDD